MKDIILSVMSIIITGVITYLGTVIKTYLDDKKEMSTKEKIVRDTVKFVEQVYRDLNGPDKYKIAKENILSMLGTKGISVTDLEIEVLIESVVSDFNFAKLWGNGKEDFFDADI